MIALFSASSEGKFRTLDFFFGTKQSRKYLRNEFSNKFQSKFPFLATIMGQED